MAKRPKPAPKPVQRISRESMRWIWTGGFVFMLLFFAFFEGYALRHPDGLTLSRYLYDVQQSWPLFEVVLGMLFGGLMVHLYWHWIPDGASRDRG